MDRLLQQTLDGLASGALYGALPWRSCSCTARPGLVNFAQGEMAMVATFLAWQFHTWGLPLVRPLVDTSHLTVVIVTLGLLLVLNSGASWVWGYLTNEFPSLFGDGVVRLGGGSTRS